MYNLAQACDFFNLSKELVWKFVVCWSQLEFDFERTAMKRNWTIKILYQLTFVISINKFERQNWAKRDEHIINKIYKKMFVPWLKMQ